MPKRLLVPLVGLGFVCVLAMWFVSRDGSTTAPGVTRTADASRSADADDLLSKPTAQPEIRRAAVVSPSPPALAESTAVSIPVGSALVKVLVVDKATRAALTNMEVYSMCDAPNFGDHGLEKTQRSRGQPFEILVTDANGRVEIVTPANVKSNLVVRGPGGHSSYATPEIPLLAENTEYDVTVELSSGLDMPFWIKLVDAETGDPLSNVKVKTELGVCAVPPATSDARGLARIEACSWQQAAMSFESEGHASLHVWTESGHERGSTALLVPLPRSATLRVHAIWAGGSAVVKAEVGLTANGYDLDAVRQFGAFGSTVNSHWFGITDGSGHLTLEQLPPNVSLDADVRGPCKWKPAEPIRLAIGEVRDVEWTITQGCEVTGSLTDQAGRPVTNQAIWLRKAQVGTATLFRAYSEQSTLKCFTDATGRFEITGVSSGSWSVGPAAKGLEEETRADDVAPLAQLVEIAEGQRAVEVNLRVDRGLFIRGHVLDSSGKPAKTVFVSAYERTLRLQGETSQSPGDGAFTIGPLMDGSYEVAATGFGDDARSDSVTVRPGMDDVVLQWKKGVSISGRVVGEDGNGVAGEVHIANRFAGESGTSMLSVANDGAFSLSGLDAGTYDLSAMTSNGWIGYIEPLAITAGGAAKDLVIRVSPGGRVRARHEGPEKYALINVVRNGVQVSGEYVELGKSGEWPSPLGTVVVRVHYYNEALGKFVRTAEKSVEVGPDTVVEVEFEKGAK